MRHTISDNYELIHVLNTSSKEGRKNTSTKNNSSKVKKYIEKNESNIVQDFERMIEAIIK